MPIEILENLGEGSYGTVTKCKWNGRLFAMKKIKDDDLGMVSVQEIDIMRSLNHPNILHAEKIYVDTDSTSIFMELADGPLHRYPIETMEHLQYIGFQMIQALAFMETMGVIHGDIKTNNFLFFNDDENMDLKVKLADFSLASHSYGGSYYPMYRMYCSPYRPLEAWFNRTTTISDVWALGCCLYELITRDILFCEQTHDELYILALESFCKKTQQVFPDEYRERLELQRKRIQTVQEGDRAIALKVRRWEEIWRDLPEFVQKMLIVDPRHRIPASKLLREPCFEAFRQKFFNTKDTIILKGTIKKHTRRNTIPIDIIRERFLKADYHHVTRLIALDMFSKCLHIIPNEEVMNHFIYACFLLAVKLTEPSRYTEIFKIPSMRTMLEEIFHAEKKICQTLNYVIYPENEEIFNMTNEEIKMFYS